jgi:hypothetical protein
MIIDLEFPDTERSDRASFLSAKPQGGILRLFFAHVPVLGTLQKFNPSLTLNLLYLNLIGN